MIRCIKYSRRDEGLVRDSRELEANCSRKVGQKVFIIWGNKIHVCVRVCTHILLTHQKCTDFSQNFPEDY